ncbi:PDZ domain-containing protein [Streptomyces sp. NPDC059009]|uniref:PDZ domain-containing protein n=1 Tax=Streptomyces sp. NPDC059009 TaxID=3346694 RepID=UPI0036B86CD7
MEQTALRPKPMPGREPRNGKKFSRFGKANSARTSGTSPTNTSPTNTNPRPPSGRRPHAARRRGRRLLTLGFGLLFATVLVLSGVGLGTVGATVIGMSKLADMQKQQGAQQPGGAGKPPGAPQGSPSGASQSPGSSKSPSEGATSGHAPPGGGAPEQPARKSARLTLGVEAVDAPTRAGALLVGVHDPGPGYTAGLVRGDVLVAFGRTPVRSAGDLAQAVAAARPGRDVTLTVRHRSGDHQALSVTPGVVT